MVRGINLGVILGSPLLLATFIIAFVAWFIAFIGMCVGEAKFTRIDSSAPLYGVSWFAIWVQILVTVFFFNSCCQDSLASHRFQLAIFLAICVVFSVEGVQNIYVKGFGASTATGVGWLLICIIDLVWLLFLSSEEDTWLYNAFTSIGNHPGWGPSRRSSGRISRAEAGYGSEAAGLRMHGADRGMSSHDMQVSNDYGNMTGGYGGTLGYAGGASSPLGTPMSKHSTSIRGEDATRPISARTADTTGSRPVMKARANYPYSASPDDPNEVSFAKGELLDVLDNTGKWFQVRLANGQTGIAPSNYLTLE